MSDILSQDEIDMLLRGNDKLNSKLNEEEKAFLSELSDSFVNILKDSLAAKINADVSMETSDIAEISDETEFGEVFGIKVKLTNSVSGEKIILFKSEDAGIISDLLIGGDGKNHTSDYTELFLEQIKEALPDATLVISNIINGDIDIEEVSELAADKNDEDFKNYLDNNQLVRIKYNLKIADVLNSEFFELISVNLVKQMTKMVLKANEPEKDEEDEKTFDKKSESKNKPVIQPVKFQTFDENEEENQANDENIEFIMDVPLQITVELGRCKKSIKEILDFNIGSIVELDNLAEDFVNVLVNGKLIARGEVIVVEENFGIRIMELYTNNRNKIIE